MKNKIKNLNETEKLLCIYNILLDEERNSAKKEYISNIIERLDKRLGKEDAHDERTNED